MKIFNSAVILGLMCTNLITSANAQENAPINAVDTDKPYVALTFDDGPDPDVFPKLLDFFKKEELHATFFIIGENAEKYPELVKRAIAEGHEIGNHSMTHVDLSKVVSEEEVRKEIVDTQKLLKEVSGTTPTLFRAPFLANGGHMWKILNEEKLPSINARVISVDYEESVSAEQIYQNTIRNAAAGDIVLNHSWREATLEVLPRILAHYKEKGLQQVTVSELLAAKKEAAEEVTKDVSSE